MGLKERGGDIIREGQEREGSKREAPPCAFIAGPFLLVVT